MKYITFLVFILSFFFQISFSEAQNQDSMYVCFGKNWDYTLSRKFTWTINGVNMRVFYHLPTIYRVFSDTVKIPIYQTEFDTVIFNNRSEPIQTIITKFEKNELYVINYINYTNSFDIEKAKYFNLIEEPDDTDIIRNVGQVKFKIINAYPYDKFIVSFGDEGFLIFNGAILYQNQESEYLTIKRRLFSLQDMCTIDIFKVRDIYEYFPSTMRKYPPITFAETGVDYNVEKYHHFFYRFFQKEKLIVIYDAKIDKIKIEIEGK